MQTFEDAKPLVRDSMIENHFKNSDNQNREALDHSMRTDLTPIKNLELSDNIPAR